ncbi:MAG: exodeoxyribonuclease VII small subunit [Pseudoflavonifractor sp.]|nr:exodeoxyribonuclease VII small subunit [Pseudoflavonifractor sp.]
MDNNDKISSVPVKELSYSQAVGQLERIVRMMQSDDVDIDLLSAYTRRAADLIAECRSRLTATDEELHQILATLDAPTA